MVMYIKGAYGVWADDLFIKALGDQTWARHIEWGLDLLWDAPNNHTKQSNGKYVVQAIELDTRMIIGDWKYHFGIQCNYNQYLGHLGQRQQTLAPSVQFAMSEMGTEHVAQRAVLLHD